jgi:hypothetical protein
MEEKMRRIEYSYDSKCLELAEYFSAEENKKLTSEELNRLSQLIQNVIEDFLTYGRFEEKEK